MPITQDRMIEVISATRRFADALKLLQSSVVSTIRDLPPNPTRDELLDTIRSIQMLCGEQLTFVKDHEILAAEERHFQTKYKKNKRTAEYARRKAATGQSSFKNSPDLSLSTSATYGSRAPTTLRPSKPLDSLLHSPAPAIDDSLLSPLTLRKIAIDAEREAQGLPPLYPDPSNDAETLQTPQPIPARHPTSLQSKLASYKPLDSDTPPDPDRELF